MCAWIRYFFPLIDPYGLGVDELAQYWRDAQYLMKMTRPVQGQPPM